ncbi:MAG: hypothetical protein GXO77_04450 [Calditrichaeota bacterium]|nr:hypothetical protein [Calditrichota bacterium]
MEPKVIVHGGAWDIPAALHQEHREGIKQALEHAQSALKSSDDPLFAVLEAIKFMESFPVFDAGRGSFLNARGEVEMDAGLMVGKDLSVGAVAAIRNVAHPIEVADLVRTKTQHAFLVGEGATEFARERGIPLVATEDLLVGRERELYLRLKKQGKVRIKSFFEKKRQRDTVGAVAINSKGEIAAGTSTGGTPYKMPGRVGDSPVPGAGFYADDRFGGASSTGWGEGILRVMLARTVIESLKQGQSAQQAAESAVGELRLRVQGDGGVIVIDRNGNMGFAYNTPHMAVGAASGEEILFIQI